YEPDNNNNRKAGTGIFTEFLQREMPWLPLEEDGRLHDPALGVTGTFMKKLMLAPISRL
ncbi:hypothetical protein HZD82_24715, partial [Pantoea agglomerans]|nr:hypothetical protein [Pantoea agglomerans]